MKKYDVLIIGAGAAGLFAAKTAITLNKTVCVIDFADKPLRKVAVSGGGRCNFTNLDAKSSRYFGQNPSFVKSALMQFTPLDMLHWFKSQGLKYIEKKPGQYFCKDTSDKIMQALLKAINKADLFLNCEIQTIKKETNTFTVNSNRGIFTAKSVIIATGGLSFPTLKVSDSGFKIAKQFGHKIVPVRPALCSVSCKAFSSNLAGISLPVEIIFNKEKINDDLLFTHFGLGGPAIYRTTVRDLDSDIIINFLPNIDAFSLFKSAKQNNGKKSLKNILGEKMPIKLANFFAGNQIKNIADYKDTDLKIIADNIHRFIIPLSDFKPYGMQSAEITKGGISTDEISSKTMESKVCSGLFFAGEVLDIAGDLGGFNLQWAWSSGYVAGLNA